MRSLGVTVAPPATARPKSGRWLYVFPIFVQGFFFVTSASKNLGSMVSSRDQKPVHLL